MSSQLDKRSERRQAAIDMLRSHGCFDEEADELARSSLARVQMLEAQVEAARVIINRGVDIMESHQVGSWAGVREWLERETESYTPSAMTREELLTRAVEAQRNDTRTPAEKVRDGAKFIMGPGGDEGTVFASPTSGRTDWPLDTLCGVALDDLYKVYGIDFPRTHSDLRRCFATIEKWLSAKAPSASGMPDSTDAARYRYIREHDDFLYTLLEELEQCSYVELSLWQQHFDSEIDRRMKSESAVDIDARAK